MEIQIEREREHVFVLFFLLFFAIFFPLVYQIFLYVHEYFFLFCHNQNQHTNQSFKHDAPLTTIFFSFGFECVSVFMCLRMYYICASNKKIFDTPKIKFWRGRQIIRNININTSAYSI